MEIKFIVGPVEGSGIVFIKQILVLFGYYYTHMLTMHKISNGFPHGYEGHEVGVVEHQSNQDDASGLSNRNDAPRLKLMGYMLSYGKIY